MASNSARDTTSSGQSASGPPRRPARTPAGPARNWRPRGWGLLLFAAGLWTLLGAVPGLVDPETAYQRFHDGPLSPEALELFRGSSGQTFLFAVGYLVAAFAPRRHALVIALGGAGKAMYAVRLLSDAAAGHTGPLTVVAAIGDLVLVAAFAVFLVHIATRRSSAGSDDGHTRGDSRPPEANSDSF